MVRWSGRSLNRRNAVAMLAGGGAAILTGCGNLFPSRYRFRMTVEVDTPQGLRSGSSVMEVASSLATWKTSDSHALETRLRGEAVAIDISPDQTLYALIGDAAPGRGLAGDVTLSFEPNYTGPNSFIASVSKLGQSDQLGRTLDLPRERYPMMVRFLDATDPQTIQLVDPTNLSSSFKTDINLRRVNVTITNDPITRGLEKRLTWLPEFYGKKLDGSRYRHSSLPANSLGSGSFSTEANDK